MHLAPVHVARQRSNLTALRKVALLTLVPLSEPTKPHRANSKKAQEVPTNSKWNHYHYKKVSRKFKKVPSVPISMREIISRKIIPEALQHMEIASFGAIPLCLPITGRD